MVEVDPKGAFPPLTEAPAVKGARRQAQSKIVENAICITHDCGLRQWKRSGARHRRGELGSKEAQIVGTAVLTHPVQGRTDIRDVCRTLCGEYKYRLTPQETRADDPSAPQSLAN
jgi:hypothetical protein